MVGMTYPEVDHEKCNGDAICYDVCPVTPNVFEMRDELSWVVNPDECIACGACEVSCPEGAITLVD